MTCSALFVKGDSEIGRRAEKYMEAGDLVPDEVVNEMVRERLTELDAADHGFVMEGFPRNVAQAEALDDMLAPTTSTWSSSSTCPRAWCSSAWPAGGCARSAA